LPATPCLAKKIHVGRGKRSTIASRQVRFDGLQEQLGDAGMAEIVRVEAVGVANKAVFDLLVREPHQHGLVLGGLIVNRIVEGAIRPLVTFGLGSSRNRGN
jgi:hypothetical protein